MKSEIEKLLEKANAADDTTTSVNFAKRSFLIESEARAFFIRCRERLFDIRQWSESSKVSTYTLFTTDGAAKSVPTIETGDFIRISITASGKNDWVRVESIADLPHEVVITVRPAYDPTRIPQRTDVISHFFHADARNNFCLQNHNLSVAFYVIGLNERQNVSDTDGLLESARNAAVANFGYYLGIQKAVWKDFCIRFLSAEDAMRA